jgi:hypothetical protein
MKILRFRAPGFSGRPDHSYGYIKANWFERRAIRKRIAERGEHNGVVEAGKAPGPKWHGAAFIIRAKPASESRRHEEERAKWRAQHNLPK